MYLHETFRRGQNAPSRGRGMLVFIHDRTNFESAELPTSLWILADNFYTDFDSQRLTHFLNFYSALGPLSAQLVHINYQVVAVSGLVLQI